MLKQICLILLFPVLFISCVPNNKRNQEKNKQVEAEVFFKSGNHSTFTYDLVGELKLENNNLIDFDSSYCVCKGVEPLATNVEAFKIIKTTSFSDNIDSTEYSIEKDTLKIIHKSKNTL